MTVIEPRPGGLREVDSGSLDDLVLDDLVADGAEVARHLADLPPLPPQRRTVTIPDRAVAVVADLDSYGD